MRQLGSLTALVLGLAWAAAPATAHHSFAAVYDDEREIEFTGTIVRVEWGNPHIYTIVRVTGEDGTETDYRVEGQAPNSLFRRGWRPDTVEPGDVVHFQGSPARNEDSPNVNGELRTDDGLVLYQGDAPDG